MKYPVFLRKFNNVLGAVSGTMMLAIAFLSVMESILRTVFKSPTMWSVDVSTYLLVCSIFLGCSYAYQEKGHVGVELFKDMIEKRRGKTPRRVMALVGYGMALVVVVVTMIAIKNLLLPALEVRQTTFANVTIPISFLYVIMIIGSVFMAVTVIFIICDLLAKEDNYI
jgi:TRAP-type C4-dicarboxylate transport system permease small subunit